MIDKPVADIEKADVDALIASARAEDRTIEYKRDLPGGGDEDRREFLRDVSAFANALGGDILYGIEENAGLPTAAPGVSVPNFDELRLRLQNTIQSNVDPRLPLVDVVHVPGFTDGFVVIIRVHQSWRGPHMVTFKGLGKFYVRGSGQRHEMDVTELRAAFVGSEALSQRIRTFRDGRLATVLSGQSSIGTFAAPTFVTHVLPVGGAFDRHDVDPRGIGSKWLALNREGMCPAIVYSPADRPNLDGLLIYSANHRERFGASPSYIQVFRNGGIEFAEALYIYKDDKMLPPPWIEGNAAEAQILDLVQNARNFRREIGLVGAALVSVALIRANGMKFGTERLTFQIGRTFDRDVVVLPDILMEDDADVHSTLRVIFDALWQAAGSKGSPNYAEDGSYTRKRVR